MLRACVRWLLARASSTSSHASTAVASRTSTRQLARRLRVLRRVNTQATHHLRARRRRDAAAQQTHDTRAAKPSSPSSSMTAARVRRAMRRAATLSSTSSTTTRRVLPRNAALASAMTFMLHEQRDARAELEFVRELLHSTLLSLASPVGAWDAFDVKPQVFAFDTRVALPVFTSLAYVRRFCRRFGFVVRDPSGALWVDGTQERQRHKHNNNENSSSSRVTAALCAGSTSSYNNNNNKNNKGDETRHIAAHDGRRNDDDDVSCALSAEALFDDMGVTTPAATATTTTAPAAASTTTSPRTRTHHGSRRGRQRRRRQRRRHVRAAALRRERQQQRQRAKEQRRQQRAMRVRDRRTRAAFVQSVATVAPLDIRHATPLPLFGAPQRDFFVGYFADMDTLLHNVSIVPRHVDLVLNPASPLELVLAREVADQVLRHEQLLHTAYRNVERELQHEFATFFAQYCPEVQRACSACVPLPLSLPHDAPSSTTRQRQRHTSRRPRPRNHHHNSSSDDDDDDAGVSAYERYAQTATARTLREGAFANEADYELVILVDSHAMSRTYATMHWAKQRGLLTGHSKLDVLPTPLAAKHVQDAAQPFYRAAHADDDDDKTQRRSTNHNSNDDDRPLGVMRLVARTRPLDVQRGAHDYFYEVDHAYTEPHALCTTLTTSAPPGDAA